MSLDELDSDLDSFPLALPLTIGATAAAPSLVEPGVRRVIADTLKKCHLIHEAQRAWVFNIATGVGLATVVVGGLLMLVRARMRRPTAAKEAAREYASLTAVAAQLEAYTQQARVDAVRLLGTRR